MALSKKTAACLAMSGFVAGIIVVKATGLSLAATTAKTTAATSTLVSTKQKIYSSKELLAVAGNDFASGTVLLGDDRYTTTGAKKGYVYLCGTRKDNPGSMVTGTWIHGRSWNFLEKVSVQGKIAWKNAEFSNTTSASSRTLTGNGLPLWHTTGVFPVAKTDPAAQFDPNPNTISTQSLKEILPVNPTYSDTPYCMGGEVGIMLSGVPLFNAFDAGLRDAPAHELQDLCDGHPQGSGEYHYHSLSACFKDIGITTVLGYALDGFPITGPLVAPGKYLTTADLDACHGVTSEIIVDGKKKTTYHYVMTQDFPYSVSCFRAQPVRTGPSGGVVSGTTNSPSGSSGRNDRIGGEPPAEAFTACVGHTNGESCSIKTPSGQMLRGVCQSARAGTQACVPR